jgi:hypothetical protein
MYNNNEQQFSVFRNNLSPANMKALFFNLTFKFVVLITQEGTLHLKKNALNEQN